MEEVGARASQPWRAVGVRLGEGRRALRLSKRAAAQRAGFSEITWRQLEAGERKVTAGVTVSVNPRDDTLAAAARAVNLHPKSLFELVGRAFDATEAAFDPPADLRTWQLSIESRLAALETRQEEVLQRMKGPRKAFVELR